MNENIKLLIEKSTKLTQERNEKIKEKLLTFNIFDICGISYDEVKVCRFLFELLNPKGRHLQGIKYLKLFFKEVLKYKLLPTDDELRNAIVMREEYITNERRIDISILLNMNNIRYYIPVEVKIYAGDQEDQCYYYYQHSLKMNKNETEKSFVYYLTPYGKYPSLYSTKKFKPDINDNGEVISCKEVRLISFNDEIYKWIKECIKNTNINDKNSDENISEKQVLLQFKKIIEDIGGNNMENQEKELKTYVANNEEIFKSAKLISDIFQKIANTKIARFYNLIDSYLENDGWKREASLDDDLEYYGIKNGKWPTMYKDIEIKGVKCELKIKTENGGSPFFGISLKEGEDKSKESILIDFLKDKALANREPSGWITWQYLPNNSEAPNFKHFNENYYLLFDKEKYKPLIEKCVNVVKEFENKINSSLLIFQ